MLEGARRANAVLAPLRGVLSRDARLVSLAAPGSSALDNGGSRSLDNKKALEASAFFCPRGERLRFSVGGPITRRSTTTGGAWLYAESYPLGNIGACVDPSFAQNLQRHMALTVYLRFP